METDFLTEPTRKLRKSLLVASLIGFAISYAGLRVSEVSLLGSKLSITKFEVIPLVLGIVVSYFLVTFLIFGLYEYSQSYRKLRNGYLERLAKGTEYSRLNTDKALKDLRDELVSLHSNMETLMAGETTRLADRDRAREIEQEISKLNRVSDFYEYYKGSIFERLRLRGMRTFFDLFVPILIGIYVAILLFFYTKIPEVEATTPKPEKEVTIGLRLSLDDANQVTSYSLIDNPEIDEQKP